VSGRSGSAAQAQRSHRSSSPSYSMLQYGPPSYQSAMRLRANLCLGRDRDVAEILAAAGRPVAEAIPLRRAPCSKRDLPRESRAFEQRGNQPRFANTCFAGEENDRAFATLCSRPAPQQQFDSSSRPTRSVRPVACRASKRLSTEDGRNAAQARRGPAIPLRSLAPRSSGSNRLPRSFRVP
jgi:hypothetical protein